MITIKRFHIVSMCVFTFLFFSCDDDVSSVGGDILTNTNISTSDFNTAEIQTENISLDSIQSNGLVDSVRDQDGNISFLGNYLLGTAQNNRSGDVDYGLLFRVEPAFSGSLDNLKEVSGATLKVDSVQVIIPYSYRIISVQADDVIGQNSYEIAGVRNEGEPLLFDVFRSDYNLELTSSSTNSSQLYYANAFDGINPFEEQISNNDIFDDFIDNNPNSNEFNVQVSNENGNRLTVGVISDAFENLGKTLRISLDKDFFGENIVNPDGTIKDASVLDTPEFLRLFKGIYIKPNDQNKNLVEVFDNSVTELQPKIEVTFTVTSNTGEETSDTIVFNMNRQVVSIVENIDNRTEDFTTAFKSKTTMTLRGAVSASRVKLFSDDNQLKAFFEQGPVVNQAILRFKINEESPLFDKDNFAETLVINILNNGAFPEGTGDNIPVDRQMFNEAEMTYDFVLTNYITNILNSTDFNTAKENNLDLVLGVSEDDFVFDPRALRIFNKNEEQQINIGSLLSTQEVPLYGSDAPEGKRPQLLIKFTETK